MCSVERRSIDRNGLTADMSNPSHQWSPLIFRKFPEEMVVNQKGDHPKLQIAPGQSVSTVIFGVCQARGLKDYNGACSKLGAIKPVKFTNKTTAVAGASRSYSQHSSFSRIESKGWSYFHYLRLSRSLVNPQNIFYIWGVLL
jgi:hypothetical protein